MENYNDPGIHLRDKPVKVVVSGAVNIKRAPADIIDGLVIKEHRNISVFQKGMC